MKQNGYGVAQQIGIHVKILLVGLAKVVYGTATAGLIALAILGFAVIPTEGGYVAVLEFIAAIATMVVALCCMYAFGGSRKKKGRYSANA